MLLYGEKEEKEKIIKELGKEVIQLEKRLSELNAGQGKSSVTDIREYYTGGECGRGKGYAGMER